MKKITTVIGGVIAVLLVGLIVTVELEHSPGRHIRILHKRLPELRQFTADNKLALDTLLEVRKKIAVFNASEHMENEIDWKISMIVFYIPRRDSETGVSYELYKNGVRTSSSVETVSTYDILSKEDREIINEFLSLEQVTRLYINMTVIEFSYAESGSARLNVCSPVSELPQYGIFSSSYYYAENINDDWSIELMYLARG